MASVGIRLVKVVYRTGHDTLTWPVAEKMSEDAKFALGY
jgi:hypothetical protein